MNVEDRNHAIDSTSPIPLDQRSLPELSSADLRLLIKSLGRMTDGPSALDAHEWDELLGVSQKDARTLLSRLNATLTLRIELTREKNLAA